jgi:hypothetical protein
MCGFIAGRPQCPPDGEAGQMGAAANAAGAGAIAVKNPTIGLVFAFLGLLVDLSSIEYITSPVNSCDLAEPLS